MREINLYFLYAVISQNSKSFHNSKIVFSLYLDNIKYEYKETGEKYEKI